MRNTIITLFIFFQSFLSFGQYSSNGMILDEYKMPLPGASVVNITQDKGVITNFDGEFSIETKDIAIL